MFSASLQTGGFFPWPRWHWCRRLMTSSGTC